MSDSAAGASERRRRAAVRFPHRFGQWSRSLTPWAASCSLIMTINIRHDRNHQIPPPQRRRKSRISVFESINGKPPLPGKQVLIPSRSPSLFSDRRFLTFNRTGSEEPRLNEGVPSVSPAAAAADIAPCLPFNATSRPPPPWLRGVFVWRLRCRPPDTPVGGRRRPSTAPSALLALTGKSE